MSKSHVRTKFRPKYHFIKGFNSDFLNVEAINEVQVKRKEGLTNEEVVNEILSWNNEDKQKPPTDEQ